MKVTCLLFNRLIITWNVGQVPVRRLFRISFLNLKREKTYGLQVQKLY